MKTLTGITMLGKDSRPFLHACLDNHINYLDEWIFQVDDYKNIPDILRSYKEKYSDIIKIIEYDCPAEENDYGRIWIREAEARNHLRFKATKDWIIQIDVDELYHPYFLETLKEDLDDAKTDFFFFMKLNFWGDKDILRIDHPWYPDIGGVKLFKNIKNLFYFGNEHPTIWYDNGNKSCIFDMNYLSWYPIYHYKRIFPVDIKQEGNFKTINLDRLKTIKNFFIHPEAAKLIC